MNTSSHWIDSVPPTDFPSADHELEVDTIVVGGGVTGITAAYLLNRAGKSVALLERGRCARIDTGHTSAHLTAMPDLRLHRLLDTFGKESARQVWDAGMAAIAKIEELVREERIDCGFQREPGYLHVPPGQDPAPHVEELKRDLAAAEELGIDAGYVESVPLFGTPGLRFPDQACFHPLRYLQALAGTIGGNGSYLLENSEAGAISDQPLSVRACGHRIRGHRLVLATHTPLQGNTGTMRALSFQTKLSLHTSYVLGGRVPAGSAPAALFWDTKSPYDYLRFESYPDYDYVVFGGEDHKTGQEPRTEAAYRRLEERLRLLFPRTLIDRRWSGQVVETNDGLPYIGEITPGQFIATGYSGNGLTFGTVAAMMAEEFSRGVEPRWQKLFDPGRVKWVGGTWTYLRENKDYPLHMLKDHFSKGATAPLESLRPGAGDIFQFQSGKIAASRDENDRITLCSAICPHLGCVVAWNQAERTWDCPCHGSRFHPDGELISGPAEEPLEKIATIHP